MRKLALAALVAASCLLTPEARADCVPLWSAHVIERGSGRTLTVFVHARSRQQARRTLEAQWGRHRVVGIRMEHDC